MPQISELPLPSSKAATVEEDPIQFSNLNDNETLHEEVFSDNIRKIQKSEFTKRKKREIEKKTFFEAISLSCCS